MPKTEKYSEALKMKVRDACIAGTFDTHKELCEHFGVSYSQYFCWRKTYGWDKLAQKAKDKREDLIVAHVAIEEYELNNKHYKVWDMMLDQVSERLLMSNLPLSDLDVLSRIMEKIQKGQRTCLNLQSEDGDRPFRDANLQDIKDFMASKLKEDQQVEGFKQR